MAFVLDASVAMAWCFEDEATPASDAVLDRLRDDQALVPPLWSYEVANVMAAAERRGRLTESQIAHLMALLHRLPINVDTAPVGIDATIATARIHRLSAYDAAYLALSERSGLPLATLDNALAGAAADAGVLLVVPR